jgi:phosphorylcholine metabolism protein LicD
MQENRRPYCNVKSSFTNNIQNKMKSYNCNYCKFQTYSLGYLFLHIKSVHSETCFACNNCEFVAVQKRTLETHTKLLHKQLQTFIMNCTHPI